MVRMCAWCDTVLGYVEPYENDKPTHTVCIKCKKIHFPDKELEEGGDVCTAIDSQNEM